jgi:hypothetical protein
MTTAWTSIFAGFFPFIFFYLALTTAASWQGFAAANRRAVKPKPAALVNCSDEAKRRIW